MTNTNRTEIESIARHATRPEKENPTMTTTKLTGYDALNHAAADGRKLNKYADPIEGARSGLTVDEAREICREDPSLIWVEVAITDDQVNSGGAL